MLDTFEMSVGGDLHAISTTGTVVRVTNVLPSLFAVEDILLSPVGSVRPLQIEEDRLFVRIESVSDGDETTSQDTAAVGIVVPLARVSIGGNDVDGHRKTSNVGFASLVKRHE